MNDVTEESLYGLIEIAERQQNVAQMVLEGMANERIAIGSELQGWSEHMTQLQGDIQAAVLNAISEAMISAEASGASAAIGATTTLESKLDGISAQAEQIEAAFRAWVRWLSWRALTLAMAGIAAMAVLGWLASCAVLWWDTSAIGSAQMKKAQLQVEIAQLQDNRDAWAAAGMVNRLARCGPAKHPCVRVDESAGQFGDNNDFRIIRSK